VSRASCDVDCPEMAAAICWLTIVDMASVTWTGWSTLAWARLWNAMTLASPAGVPSLLEKNGSSAEAVVDGKMPGTIWANFAWFSALVRNRARAIAVGTFFEAAETDTPCT
jgi:hypothetical protein